MTEHINGNSGICVLCDEAIDTYEAWVPLNPSQYAHHECSLRSVLGGIGHHLGHEYWCLQQRDTDAGLTYRQSSQMVAALVDLLGVEEVVKRGAMGEGLRRSGVIKMKDDDGQWKDLGEAVEHDMPEL
jgi:hypothetical protein